MIYLNVFFDLNVPFFFFQVVQEVKHVHGPLKVTRLLAPCLTGKWALGVASNALWPPGVHKCSEAHRSPFTGLEASGCRRKS